MVNLDLCYTFGVNILMFNIDPTVGSIDTDLLSRFSCCVRGKAAIGRRRCVVPIQRYSIENSLRKHVKNF